MSKQNYKICFFVLSDTKGDKKFEKKKNKTKTKTKIKLLEENCDALINVITATM